MIDGVDIRNYNLADLRRMLGFVMQEPTLFNYSIYENILYGKMDASNEELRKAAEISNSIEFIETDDIVNVFDDAEENLLREWQHYE